MPAYCVKECDHTSIFSIEYLYACMEMKQVTPHRVRQLTTPQEVPRTRKILLQDLDTATAGPEEENKYKAIGKQSQKR